MRQSKDSSWMGWGLAMAMVLVAGLGWWAGEGRGLQLAEGRKHELLLQAMDLARGINPGWVKQLSFNEADRGIPGFDVIREHLTIAGKRVANRGIYTLARRQGRLFFGPENYAVEDPMASAPGTMYQKAPTEVLEIFRTGQPAVVGPYRDEYGVFVSAWAPVFDPATGEVIMTVGLDILAKDWQAGIDAVRRGPILASLLVIGLLLGAAVLVRWGNRPGKPVDFKLKALIITPVAAAMVCVMVFGITYQLQASSEESNRDMDRFVESGRREWSRLIDSQVAMLKAQADHLVRDAGLTEAWTEGDPVRLLSLLKPVYAELRRDYKIDFVYLVQPDRSCFLRVHNPARRGDLIGRHTLLTAVRTGEDDWGVEAGPTGTFTLRYVRPWTHEGRLLGYLELGMDIRHLVGRLAGAQGVDLVTVIHKKATSRESYEAGIRSYGYTGQWETYPELVVLYQTVREVPQDLARRFRAGPEAVGATESLAIGQGNRTLQCGLIRQPDAAGLALAEIILIRDQTGAFHKSRNMLVLNIGLIVALFGGILALLWSITGKAQGHLAGAFLAVQEQRQLLETIINAISAPVFYKDRQGVFTGCNKAFEKLLGRPREDIIGKMPWDIAPPELAEIYLGADQALLSGGEAQEYETETVAADGTIRQVIFHKAPFRSVDGRISGLVGAVLDITERKQAEEALRVSEQRIRGLLNATADSVFLLEPSGVIIDLNKNAAERRGKKRGDLLGGSVFDFLHPHAAEERRAALARVVSSKSMYAYDEERDGKVYGLRLYPIFNEIGEVVQMASFSRDNTERKNLEEQLRQAMKMEAVGTLAGGVAHDFNNLIQAIKGYSELLLMDKEERHRDYAKLKAIYQAGERAAQLVRQLLLFSRKAEAERRTIELNQQIEQAGKILERTLPKMIDIEFRPAAALRAINADPVQIEQILLNLGSNAADAMPDGGKLTIETSNVSLDEEFSRTHIEVTPGYYVLLSVSDTGQGMDRETIQKIFLPFFTTKGIGKGTGLGLASVYGIVKGHGGHIVCESEPGEGTIFRIYFPAVGKAVDSAIHRQALPQRGGGETILLVDDEEALRECNSQVLRRFGYKVITASSGEEALEIHADLRREIDLVLMDLSMPGMGGYNCLRELKGIDPEVKVFIASGYSDGDQLKRVFESGAAGYIGKPYRLTELLGKIRGILDGQEKEVAIQERGIPGDSEGCQVMEQG